MKKLDLALPETDSAYLTDAGETVRVRFRVRKLIDQCEHCATRYSPETEFIAICCTACLCRDDGVVCCDERGRPEWKLTYSYSIPLREWPGYEEARKRAEVIALENIEAELKLRREALKFDVEDLA